MRKLTRITFYQNTPFTDFNNTVNFGSNEKRDAFFASHYKQKTSDIDFNFIRDRLTLRVSSNLLDWQFLCEVNYIKIESAFDGLPYYAMAVETTYLNDGTTQLNLVIDGLMTFCQGDISSYVYNAKIEREHLTEASYKANLKYLRSNGDVLDIPTLQYKHQIGYRFSTLMAVITSSADLSADFGTVDAPSLKTSKGTIYDGVTSPQDLYVVNYNQFNDLMKALQPYPWISQNITSILLIPSDFIDFDDLQSVTMKTGDFSELKKFKSGHYSKTLNNITQFKRSITDLANDFDYQDVITNLELMREPYTNIELTNWQGQTVGIDPASLPDYGLEIIGQISVGYSNKAYFFPRQYNENGESSLGDGFGTYTGAYLNNAIVFDKWDDLPMLIDNYRLDRASTANQRALAENNQMSGLAGNVTDNSKDLQTRLMSAVSLMSNASVSAVTGKLTDEWQFYRNQQAQFKDKKLSKPTITQMTNENSFNIKNKIFGIFLKFSRIDNEGMKAVQRYHKHFGYAMNRIGKLDSVMSMSHMNYAKFSGNWILSDRHVPQSIMEQIRVQFESGVKMWHNPDNISWPFTQDITELNRRIK